MTPTLTSVLKSIQPDGEYAVVGALALVGLAVGYWYTVKGVGKAVNAVDSRNLSWIYVLPLLALFVYLTVMLVTTPVPAQGEDAISGILLVLTLFQAFALAHLGEVYPNVMQRIWSVLLLGLPSSVMGNFWLTAYLTTLAFLVPSTIGALSAMAAGGVFFSMAVFRAGATWLTDVNGGRRLAGLLGHLLLATTCAALAGVYPYSSKVLATLAEVYCTGMIALGGCLLYLDRFEERVQVLPTVNSPFGPCISVAAGVVLACMGFAPSAWILIPIGLLGLVIEYTHRTSRSA